MLPRISKWWTGLLVLYSILISVVVGTTSRPDDNDNDNDGNSDDAHHHHHQHHHHHPKLRRALRTDDLIPNEYIVVLRKDLPRIAGAFLTAEQMGHDMLDRFRHDDDDDDNNKNDGDGDGDDTTTTTTTTVLKQTFESALSGFSAKLSPFALVSVLEDERVAYVEENMWHSVANFQFDAPYPLDRIDQDLLPLDGAYGYEQLGTGVDVYVLDTGLYRQHSQFQGRAFCSKDIAGSPYNDCPDQNGHGTHVAGLIGSQVYGVAKQAKIYSVRVCNAGGYCTTEDIVAGLNHVAAKSGKRVANVSIWSNEQSATLEDARQGATAAGVVIVWAAGNSGINACASMADSNYSIAVGATNAQDQKWTSSNWGPCVDLFAPGQDVWSTNKDGGILKLSGTSMAAPHVAGAAALLLEEGIAPENVLSTLLERGVKDRLSRTGTGSPNVLLSIPHNLTFAPSQAPSDVPSTPPSAIPSSVPTYSLQPSAVPSRQPSSEPSSLPTAAPSSGPSQLPSLQPSIVPSTVPSLAPSVAPSNTPSLVPSDTPTDTPSRAPSAVPTDAPSAMPTVSSCPANRVGSMCWFSWRCCPGYQCQNHRVLFFLLGRCLPASSGDTTK